MPVHAPLVCPGRSYIMVHMMEKTQREQVYTRYIALEGYITVK